MKTLAAAIAFNEELKIGNVLGRFTPGLVEEIVVVDDGSTDRTGQVSGRAGATVLRHESRCGAGAAIRTAIHYGQKHGFDIIVVLAGNDKDRPAEIPRLTQPIVNDGYDLVQGSRYLPGGSHGNTPLSRRLGTGIIHPFLFSLAVRRRVTESTNGFRAIRLSIFDDPRIAIDQTWLDKYELEPYILYKAIRLGYRVKEVPVTKIYPDWKLGYTKMKPVTGWWSIVRPIFFLSLGLRK